MTSKTECERLADVSGQSQTISDFLEWLEIEGIELSRPDAETNGWSLPITERPDSLLMRYFGIDAIRLEAERRALLRAAVKTEER